MEKISDTLAGGRRGQFERLGYLTQQQKERGVWLSQAAADMESLELQRDAWQVVDESNYKALMKIKDKHVFLIHVSFPHLFRLLAQHACRTVPYQDAR